MNAIQLEVLKARCEARGIIYFNDIPEVLMAQVLLITKAECKEIERARKLVVRYRGGIMWSREVLKKRSAAIKLLKSYGLSLLTNAQG